jgi:periplasmic protein CpxP/Spy
MKSKVRIILTALTMFAVVFALQAQRGQRQQLTPEQRAEKQTEMMTEKLSLTPEQASKIKDINLKYADKHKAQKDEAKGEREKNRSAMQQLQDERKAEINAVLNKDQQAKYEQMQAKNRKAGPGKGGPGPKAGRSADPEKRAECMTQHMTEKLDLSGDQATKVKAINLDFAKQKQALRAEAPEGQRPEKKAVEKLRQQHQDQLKKVLTKEQFSQWEQMAKERKHDHKGKGKHHPRTKGM